MENLFKTLDKLQKELNAQKADYKQLKNKSEVVPSNALMKKIILNNTRIQNKVDVISRELEPFRKNHVSKTHNK